MEAFSGFQDDEAQTEAHRTTQGFLQGILGDVWEFRVLERGRRGVRVWGFGWVGLKV